MSARPTRIGLYGKGYWATILREKLESLGSDYELCFEADSQHPHLDESSLRSIDWAVVATPPETHFEIADTCLRAGVNVFCEKPLSLSSHEVAALYDAADEAGVALYVDDVFVWRTEFATMSQRDVSGGDCAWHKAEATPLTGLKLAQDLAYHHLYLLGTLLDFPDFTCELDEFREGLSFRLSIAGHGEISLSYTKNAAWTRNDVLGVDFSKRSNDALLEMLEAVISGTASFAENRRRVIWTTRVMRAVVSAAGERVAVVGGGVFGCTAALELAKHGYDVTLYESGSDIILGATLKNQLRVHRGYHYPRSDETAQQCLRSEYKFLAYFRPAIDGSAPHHYAIASERSKVSAEAYESFMRRHGLRYERVENSSIGDALQTDAVAAIYAVQESSYSPERLREHLRLRCEQEGVRFVFNTHIGDLSVLTRDFARVVVATYSSPLSDVYGDVQFEICEKPVVRLPERFRGLSMVIMDGPFVSLDPFSGDSALHLIGSVDDAIHHVSVGRRPEIPIELEADVAAGLVVEPRRSRIDDFRKRFTSLYDLAENEIEHIGSYFVVRAVEANRDFDDRRVSVLQELNAHVYNIFSAKVTSAPLIAQSLLRHLEVAPLPAG